MIRFLVCDANGCIVKVGFSGDRETARLQISDPTQLVFEFDDFGHFAIESLEVDVNNMLIKAKVDATLPVQGDGTSLLSIGTNSNQP